MGMMTGRRLPIGAEPVPGGGVAFRVWAPERRRVEVVFDDGRAPDAPLEAEPGGYHSGTVARVGPGARYRYRLDGEGPFPDPASRFQPEGPHGPSEVIDPGAYGWSDASWRGAGPEGRVLYELHVGTFTGPGTWEAAAEELPALAELGITTIELMPVADFPGRFGWGYDGVDFFAPTRLYGRPEAMKRFVDRAHRLGLGVILDVVYNHFGPDGNDLPTFSPHYVSKRHKTDWGDSPNFDGEGSGPVREFVLANVAYWIAEFHLDGLRVDATQDVNDDSPEHLLTAISRAARSGPASELVLAADQFLITPAGRVEDAARARAAGDELRTVIAGYHWFTDWGRDTMISLDGLTLCTGRQAEARDILRTFARAIRDGLIPNLYPEGDSEGLYHTADATLWFFHAIDRFVRATGDRSTLEFLVPRLREVVEHHLRGTRHGIRIDPADGLMTQGEEGYQLTWMDAKVGDWVVTPRRGKAVELNALWYNALKNLEGWVRDLLGDAEARPYAEHADRCRRSFNERFWYAEGGYLLDVVDGEGGDDPACRPNQIFAISLPNPVLDRSRWAPVFEVVRDRLLTPVGLRSLAPGHPDYKPKYFGDLHARDAAYHQGTVWGWLIGPFVDAWLKVHPDDRAGARRWLEGLLDHLDDFCVGSIAEVFDAEPPFAPRGCVAQAWSVAEVLRCLILTAD